MAKRTAQEVIDQAIKENKIGEWLLYFFACLFVGSGTTILLHAVFYGTTTQTLIGAVSNGLFYPSMKLAKIIRKENIAIRLLEASLARADTAQDAAKAIRAAFSDAFTDSKNANNKIENP